MQGEMDKFVSLAEAWTFFSQMLLDKADEKHSGYEDNTSVIFAVEVSRMTVNIYARNNMSVINSICNFMSTLIFQ